MSSSLVNKEVRKFVRKHRFETETVLELANIPKLDESHEAVTQVALSTLKLKVGAVLLDPKTPAEEKDAEAALAFVVKQQEFDKKIRDLMMKAVLKHLELSVKREKQCEEILEDEDSD